MYRSQGKDITKEGDTILLFAGKGNLTKVVLKHGETYCHRFGAFRHDELIGKPYGSRIQCSTKSGQPGRGFAHILLPDNPDLWSVGPLDHHTQIIYPMDISQICFHLEIFPGKRVIESGTGSGSLSLGFARCLYPTGRLDTFEFHEERMLATKAHFKEVGLDHIIHSHQRDVITNGFDVPDGCADAVFLDLPAPWKVVEDAYRCLNATGNFCSFSPCIEQIQRTCEKLREVGFEDIRVIECLLRTYEVGLDSFEDLKIEEKIKKDLESGPKQKALEESEDMENESKQIKKEGEESGAKQIEEKMPASVLEVKEDVKTELGKRVREEEEDGNKEKGTKQDETTTQRFSSKMRRWSELPDRLLYSRPSAEIKGHTSYLLFARKIFVSNKEKVEESKEEEDVMEQ